MKIKKIVIAGGSGFLGEIICRHFYKTEIEVIILTRTIQPANKNIRYEKWDGKNIGKWKDVLEGADAVINLTGRSVDCRYTEKNKNEIISSRISATTVVGMAIAQCTNPPRLWMNASSAAIYKNSEYNIVDDYSTEYGEGFSIDVCKQWEKAFHDANTPQTRKVTLRISLILGNSGGVWPVWRKLVKFGLGGRQASGNQYVSWMHETDFVNSIQWFIENDFANGAYNLASQHPIKNKELMKLIRNKYNIPFGLPSFKWMLEIGAFIIRTETELVVKSRRVVSKRLIDEGFEFKFGQINEAIDSLN